jgi:hypothetical protein
MPSAITVDQILRSHEKAVARATARTLRLLRDAGVWKLGAVAPDLVTTGRRVPTAVAERLTK